MVTGSWVGCWCPILGLMQGISGGKRPKLGEGEVSKRGLKLKSLAQGPLSSQEAGL